MCFYVCCSSLFIYVYIDRDISGIYQKINISMPFIHCTGYSTPLYRPPPAPGAVGGYQFASQLRGVFSLTAARCIIRPGRGGCVSSVPVRVSGPGSESGPAPGPLHTGRCTVTRTRHTGTSHGHVTRTGMHRHRQLV